MSVAAPESKRTWLESTLLALGAYGAWLGGILVLLPLIAVGFVFGYFAWMYSQIEELPDPLKIPLLPIKLLCQGIAFVLFFPVRWLGALCWRMFKWAMAQFRAYMASGHRGLRLLVRYLMLWGRVVERIAEGFANDTELPVQAPESTA